MEAALAANPASVRQYAHELTIFRSFLLEFHMAVCLGEKGVVFSHADVEAGVDFRTTLAHEDISGNHKLPGIFLNA